VDVPQQLRPSQLRDGIWFDTTANAGAVIDGNRVEDNGRNGIFFEASIGATISNNTVRRTWATGVISMSQNAQIYSNTLDGNFGASNISSTATRCPWGGCEEQCGARQHGRRRHAELPYASGFSYLSSCTSTQLAPYLNGSKNLTFSRNAYRVPSLSIRRYCLWGGWKYWTEWQALGQDVGGNISQ
jgi:parallel beta-helix repeat protein